jgi:excisionase family DNA binding protein
MERQQPAQQNTASTVESVDAKIVVHTKILTPKELAELLKVQVSWIYEQTRKGTIPCVKLGKYYRFHLDEVLAHYKTNVSGGKKLQRA